ncbi:uncharacterized protein MYCFIDRAFT_170194 [Pseudocercospora fijiensis CIRAD86]|uniref:Uncharacterized protein n=1 Tax=Pseudocercospora fijiensis (strain CIRAD86) TaxID=383855 RepID=N1QBN9_PSEFD|nr:uncharacterized protein MYCFIDRAFT_170194 [Pseudocercospora fijiensis CIRAD86]EME88608.1 hypothetical protein MYCFIDRAFT_170194 [Pseudocercospora fijiensis CIRAD86]
MERHNKINKRIVRRQRIRENIPLRDLLRLDRIFIPILHTEAQQRTLPNITDIPEYKADNPNILNSNHVALALALGSLDINNAQARIPEEELVNALKICSASHDTSVQNIFGKRDVGIKSRHHEISYKFPAYELLPPGIPFGPRHPLHLQHRLKPKIKTFMLEREALVLTSRIPAKPAESVDFAPAAQQSLSIFEAVQALQQCAGTTEMQIIRYFEKNDYSRPVYRFRLTTVFTSGQGKSAIQREDFKYEEKLFLELLQYVELKEKKPWAADLRSLIFRATDLTFLVVSKAMLTQDFEAEARDIQHLESRWNTHPAEPYLEVLNRRIERIDPPLELDDISYQTVKVLACGHEFEARNLEQMTEDDCKRFICERCDARVMTSNDDIRLSYFDDRLERVKWEEDANGYATLETQMLPHQFSQFRIYNIHFKQALNTALHSLVLPASVMHQAQNPVHGAVTKETDIILLALNKYFRADWFVVTVQTAPTIALLTRIAIGALKEYHGVPREDQSDRIFNIAPLNYRYFLLKWFTRAVLLMISGTINLANQQAKKDYFQMVNSFDGLSSAEPPAGAAAFSGLPRCDRGRSRSHGGVAMKVSEDTLSGFVDLNSLVYVSPILNKKKKGLVSRINANSQLALGISDTLVDDDTCTALALRTALETSSWQVTNQYAHGKCFEKYEPVRELACSTTDSI